MSILPFSSITEVSCKTCGTCLPPMTMSGHLDVNIPKNKCKTCYPDVEDEDKKIPELIDSSDDDDDEEDDDGVILDLVEEWLRL